MFQIALRTVRESCGYSIEAVSAYCGILPNTLNEIEINSTDAPLSIIRKILSLYNVSAKLIYFGTELDCIEHNKSPYF